jgi:hypothetical protein
MTEVEFDVSSFAACSSGAQHRYSVCVVVEEKFFFIFPAQQSAASVDVVRLALNSGHDWGSFLQTVA